MQTCLVQTRNSQRLHGRPRLALLTSSGIAADHHESGWKAFTPSDGEITVTPMPPYSTSHIQPGQSVWPLLFFTQLKTCS